LDFSQFQSEDAPLSKLQSAWDHQRIASETAIPDYVVEDLHGLGLIEEDLDSRRRSVASVSRDWDGFWGQDTWAWASDHGTRLGQAVGWRHVVPLSEFAGIDAGKDSTLG
jgi:hypothetical protein